MPKCGVISSPYFLAFSPNTGKDGREIIPYLDTFYAVQAFAPYKQRTIIENKSIYQVFQNTL